MASNPSLEVPEYLPGLNSVKITAEGSMGLSERYFCIGTTDFTRAMFHVYIFTSVTAQYLFFPPIAYRSENTL